MKANELRIGNFINYKGAFCEFSIEDFEETKNNSQFLTLFCRPIPMSGYWLSRFGFLQDQEDSCRWYLLEGSIAYDLDDNRIRISDSWEWAHINYVHELQNLYYALTGEELALK